MDCSSGCNSPLNECYTSPGSCQDGYCIYGYKTAGTQCGSGTCDGAGKCQSECLLLSFRCSVATLYLLASARKLPQLLELHLLLLLLPCVETCPPSLLLNRSNKCIISISGILFSCCRQSGLPWRVQVASLCLLQVAWHLHQRHMFILAQERRSRVSRWRMRRTRRLQKRYVNLSAGSKLQHSCPGAAFFIKPILTSLITLHMVFFCTQCAQKRV